MSRTRFLSPLQAKYKGVVLTGFVLLAVCAVFAVYGSRGVNDLLRFERAQDEAEDVAFRLKQRNQALRRHLQRLEHDDAYLEKLAREKLGWIKPGEMVYRVDKR
jgi:cell division protein FtsB